MATTHYLGLAIPDMRLPRMQPCSALIFPAKGIECAATPASKYRRFCSVATHKRIIWLCPVHAAMVVSGGTICRECAEHGGVEVVSLIRLSDPIRL